MEMRIERDAGMVVTLSIRHGGVDRTPKLYETLCIPPQSVKKIGRIRIIPVLVIAPPAMGRRVGRRVGHGLHREDAADQQGEAECQRCGNLFLHGVASFPR